MTRAVEILEIFAEAQRLVSRPVATEEGGLEALRRAYRERHAVIGLCRSCPAPAQAGRRHCARHLAESRRRARLSRENIARAEGRTFRERTRLSP